MFLYSWIIRVLYTGPLSDMCHIIKFVTWLNFLNRANICFYFCKFQCVIFFSFMDFTYNVITKYASSPNLSSQRFPLCFFFNVLFLTFKTMNCFKLIVYKLRHMCFKVFLNFILFFGFQWLRFPVGCLSHDRRQKLAVEILFVFWIIFVRFRKSHPIFGFLRVFITNVCWIYLYAFSASGVIFIWFSIFNLFLWWILLIVFKYRSSLTLIEWASFMI